MHASTFLIPPPLPQTLPVCKLGLPQSLLSSAELVRSASLMCGDEAARQEGLEGLTILELCLLVAMSHVSDTSQGDPVNFEMVYCGEGPA